MKRVLLGLFFSWMLSLTLAGNGLAQATQYQGKKPERPVERDKPKDDKRNDRPKEDKRDGKKKPNVYEG